MIKTEQNYLYGLHWGYVSIACKITVAATNHPTLRNVSCRAATSFRLQKLLEKIYGQNMSNASPPWMRITRSAGFAITVAPRWGHYRGAITSYAWANTDHHII
ncbi:MAG: hypothetical protein WBO73_11995 [Gammaproteobacteria bacterium]